MCVCVCLSGVQHVPGDVGGLHHVTQRGASGLAVYSAHAVAEENGGRSSGVRPGQSSASSRRHQVWAPSLQFGLYINAISRVFVYFLHSVHFLCLVFTGIRFRTISSSTSWCGLLLIRRRHQTSRLARSLCSHFLQVFSRSASLWRCHVTSWPALTTSVQK